jgi:ribonucleoside-diphosphate reductase alpha chain
MDQLQQYIHLSRYARYLDSEQRRETWDETVSRYCQFFKDKFPEFPYEQVWNGIHSMEVMPSMRALMSAGPALDRDNMAGYNCSYLPIESLRSFDEILYILTCGTGVGFSVERQFIAKLPEVPDEMYQSDTTIQVADSKIGWASAFRELLALLFSGKIPKWDTSKVRPAGSRLKTFGGRASGPEPLEDLFRFTVALVCKAQGRKLTSLEVHDLVCKIADIVVVGGVRRSALLSLSNLTDERMRSAKSGQWWELNQQRALANNSVAYTEKPDMGIFMREWESLYASKSGERGVFNRVAAKHQAESTGRRDPNFEFGTNPCGEIILRPHGLCNLSEVIVRSGDTFGDLRRKVELATIIGTFQSTLTDFRYVRKVWQNNAEEERLLGVSFTGIMDHPVLAGVGYGVLGFADPDGYLAGDLRRLKNVAVSTNAHWASRLGINPSVAITTVKPSGTVSQLVDSASGIHPRYSCFYIRTVRADKKDPLALFMREKGFPVEDDVTKPEHTDVFMFPVRSPEGSRIRTGLTAVKQLDHYLDYKRAWCEHNPSITVYVREHEWMAVGAWVFANFGDIGGVSFLPYDSGTYRQAPYQEVSEEEYNALKAKMPVDVDWTELREDSDRTTGSQDLACLAGVCEVL